jgi:sugar-specific transcriptional regulator TrmB
MKEELEKFGLNSTEQDILIFLLRFGSRSAGIIAQKLNIKRPTVYSALDNLIKFNLVHKDQVDKSFTFKAIRAEDIPETLLRNEEIRLEKLKFSLDLLKRPLEELGKRSNTRLGHFEFELVESTERYTELMFQNNCFKNHYAIWDPNIAVYDDEVKRGLSIFFDKTATQKNKIQEILVKGPVTDWYISQIKNKNHTCKTIDSKIITVADLAIYEEDIVLFSLNNPHSEAGLVIHNKDLFTFMKQMFDLIWLNAR